MHLIKDENGNVIHHGHEHTHEHTHTHEDGHEYTHTHGHSHEHSHDHDHHHDHNECGEHHNHCGSCNEGDCKNETVALLTYMLQHNEHHAAELDQMADNLVKLGMDAAAKTIKEAVADFQKGNMRLGLALTLVKEELKEQK
ncbi:MAG: cobalt transporter [Eubacteriales bacterium]|nr:cobalt transporter [Eubacteriales bacterium]